MLRSRFLWKLYAGYALVILFSSLFIGLLITRRVESETLAEMDRRLSAIALAIREPTRDYFLADPSGAGLASALQKRFVRLGQETGTRLTVVRKDGLVLVDSDRAPERMENHADRPEIVQAYQEGVGRSTRFSKTLGARLRYVAVPLVINGEAVATVRSSLPFTVLKERLVGVRRAVFLGAMLATTAALLVGFLHAQRVTRPILSMVKAAEEIAEGAYDQRITSPSRVELGVLARAFNSMSRELRGTISALNTDRNKLSAILSAMEEGVIAVDRDERVVHMNGVAADLLKLTADQALGRPIWEIVRLREVPEILGKVLARAENTHEVVRLPGSPERVLDLRARPLWAENGLAGAVLILQDLSRLRHLETMRQDFVANVSHELKTPVTVVRGMVETMLDDPDMGADHRNRFLQKVLLQAERMASLIKDLLSLAHLESMDELTHPALLDLADVARFAVKALQPVFEGRGVEVQMDIPDQPLIALGDEEFLAQAIMNLLSNAIKFSPAGETVRLRLLPEGEMAVIEVEDHGIGIEAEHKERLFERFYRVDTGRSRALGGTGLGLAIVKHIALSMDGSVSVESTPGVGSIFRIHLPVRGADAV